jgi:hypothetical protein
MKMKNDGNARVCERSGPNAIGMQPFVVASIKTYNYYINLIRKY